MALIMIIRWAISVYVSRRLRLMSLGVAVTFFCGHEADRIADAGCFILLLMDAIKVNGVERLERPASVRAVVLSLSAYFSCRRRFIDYRLPSEIEW